MNFTTSLTNEQMETKSFSAGPHTFFIPVMGTGFTIDTPLKVARYGIDSVMSIGDDMLIERMRKYYAHKYNKPFTPIITREKDARTKRIRAYLNLMHEIVYEQVNTLRSDNFTTDSDLTRYFTLLPEGPIKTLYLKMVETTDESLKNKLQQQLRQLVTPGSLDVNIMTKVDREQSVQNGQKVAESGLAMTALKGFATSCLESGIVLSAGINKRLFAYMAQFDDFYPTDSAPPKKRIILKVSDYRSALLQGTILAKRGLWVSEYRLESGLNCGGHAFATKGELLGPVLREFQKNRKDLIEKLKKLYLEAIIKTGRSAVTDFSIILSAQGGVGTADEHDFLINQFSVDRIGWGTPFLLVPQATNVDLPHLRKLAAANERDVSLSEASPLGVPFWLLHNSSSDNRRKLRIEQNNPGSTCTKRYLAVDTDSFSQPVCAASTEFQQTKLQQLHESTLSPQQKESAAATILSKTCLCMDLAGGILNRLNLAADTRTAVCSGLSIIDFNRIYTLKEMIDHIYGRTAVSLNKERPNMFMRELSLYIDHLKRLIKKNEMQIGVIPEIYLKEFSLALEKGINFYRDLTHQLKNTEIGSFQTALDSLESRLETIKHKLFIELPRTIPAVSLARTV